MKVQNVSNYQNQQAFKSRVLNATGIKFDTRILDELIGAAKELGTRQDIVVISKRATNPRGGTVGARISVFTDGYCSSPVFEAGQVCSDEAISLGRTVLSMLKENKMAINHLLYR